MHRTKFQAPNTICYCSYNGSLKYHLLLVGWWEQVDMNIKFQISVSSDCCKMCHCVQLLAGSWAGVTNGLDMEMETVRPSV